MSDDNNNTNPSNEPTATPVTLLAEVALRVKESNPAVIQRYIDRTVEAEQLARVDLLDKAMQKRFQLLTELNKVNRPDVEHCDETGKVVSGHYTKERAKALKDARENLAKVENAINKALANDWSKLKEQK